MLHIRHTSHIWIRDIRKCIFKYGNKVSQEGNCFRGNKRHWSSTQRIQGFVQPIFYLEKTSVQIQGPLWGGETSNHKAIAKATLRDNLEESEPKLLIPTHRAVLGISKSAG